MNELTFLESKQVFSENSNIFKKYGTIASPTDFSILLGAYVTDNYYTSEGKDLADRAGVW